MAIAGEPLVGRHAVALYSVQVSKGTPVTPATPVGVCPFRVTNEADLRRVLSIGAAAPILLKPGINQVPFTLPIQMVQEGTLLAQVIRSGGEPPWFTLGLGYRDDANARYAWQVQDCKLHSAEVSLEAGGVLSATLSGVGGLITDLTTLIYSNTSDTPFMSYEAVLTKGGAAYESRSFRLQIENNVQVETVIPGTAPSTFKRGWSYQTAGPLFITGEVQRFARSAINLQADLISDFALQLACTDIAGGVGANAITFALTGVKFGSETLEAEIEGRLLWNTPFEATGITITVV